MLLYSKIFVLEKWRKKMGYLEKAIFWKGLKSSLGTAAAAILWQVIYRTQIPIILLISVFLLSFVAYILIELWEGEKINTVFAFINSNKGSWEYCRATYKGNLVFGALLRNGTSIVEMAICVKPDKMGLIEKREFLEMNGGIIRTNEGNFILNASEKEIILCKIEKVT